MTKQQTVRLAAVGDTHIRKTSQGALKSVLAPLSDAADVLLLCGDLTDYGLPEEAQVLAKELSAIDIPMVGVLGNHDYESGQAAEVCRILTDAGVKLLDGESVEIGGVGFAGAKGFAGGFGRGTLGAWGEPAIKSFVQEALDETRKFESALARLRTRRRVALLHCSPVCATVQGEPAEIYSWLGTSRLEEPLNRYPVDVVFHGHAHYGSPEGRTQAGVLVFNVALPLLRTRDPERPIKLYELAGEAEPQRDASLGQVSV